MMVNWDDPTKTGVALGVEAVKWGEAWTSLIGPFEEFDVVTLAVNQLREVIDTGGGRRKKRGYGKPTTTPRGKALKFYSHVRLSLQGKYLDMSERPSDETDGQIVKIRVVKNKTSDDARGVCEYVLIRGKGFDIDGDLIQLALDSGAIKASGSWMIIGGKIKVQGRKKVAELISNKPQLKEKLEKYIERYLSKLPLEEFHAEEDED
jgi:recombination protein RecA